ncbi:uncharacterized protein LOC123898894 [Trifolium pratense]|uniref:Uncharacterized protein n=1 Tax=Trifolium pratense TaxID=57577 RepID=A0ACB0KU51_TRIPR|nr:uncharacterized protein LOC123898894 [Trifolium pratense]CAJ2660697.1 unnamed protein product [Trifolium pratense]
MSSSSVSEKRFTAVEIEEEYDTFRDDIYMWQQTFDKSKSNEDNVIKFPKRVVEECLSKEQKSITLIYEEDVKSYECDIETMNDGSNEKYISKAWFQCVEEMGVKDGAKLLFTAQNPPENMDLPPTKMYVYVIEF